MAMVFHRISMVTMVLPWYSMEVTVGFYMTFPWSRTMAMVFHRIFMVFHGIPWKLP